MYDRLPTLKPRLWYLERAYKTIVAMFYQVHTWYTHVHMVHCKTSVAIC